jgi:hypothetical protein
MNKNLILFLLSVHALFAATPWQRNNSNPLPKQLQDQVLKNFKTDPALLTWLQVKPWKSYPMRYVAFGCFAVDRDAYFHSNNDYSENGKFQLKPNCQIDHDSIQGEDYEVQKNTELMIFDLDSLGMIHIRQRAFNITDPWIVQDSNARIQFENRSEPQKYRPECDCNGDECCPETKTLFDDFRIEAKPGLWSTPQPGEEQYGGFPLTFESLDLAPYRITDTSVALGIRIRGNQSFAGSGVNNTQFLLLFEPRADSLYPVMATVMATLMAYENQIAGESNQNSPRDLSGSDEGFTLKLGTSSHHGYRDLEIWSTGDRIWDLTKGRTTSQKSKPYLSSTLIWNPKLRFYVEAPRRKLK